KLAHVEAGLRSFNNRMPEEINRILTDRVSDVLFCPTHTAIKNLENEGYRNFKEKSIILSGDIMYDASLYYATKIDEAIEMKSFILCTVHRAENTDDAEKMETIFTALNRLGE